MSLKETLVDHIQTVFHADPSRITFHDIQEVLAAPSDQKDMIIGGINERMKKIYKKGLTPHEYEVLLNGDI